MKKIILMLALLSMSLFADVKNTYVTQKIVDSNLPIVDVRTPPEWRSTGLLKGAIPIMFFNQQGKYNTKRFLKELNAKVDTTKPFAIICHTGGRTSIIAPFLSKDLGYKVINLKGGMHYARKVLKLKTYPYTK